MSKIRILGVAIRARWLGYVTLDEGTKLVDWGMIFYQRRAQNELRSAKRRLDETVNRFTPSSIVLVLPRLKSNEAIASVRAIVRSLHASATGLSIGITLLNRDRILVAFSESGARTKDEIASVLAREFPELAWKLPPERKIWNKEDSKMAIFDALAGTIAAYKSKSQHNSDTDDL